MKKFITYFDFLGFKNFILNNDSNYIKERIGHILRDIEFAIGLGKTTNTDYGIIANIENSRINCLNISDTVIFWTNDNSLESFEELLKVSFEFNWRIIYHFPIRGSLVYDDIGIISGFQRNKNEGSYNVNSIYGKGLVNSHIKAENLNLASCVIDNSVIEKIKEFGSVEQIIGDVAIKYDVPYKNDEIKKPEYVLKYRINKNIDLVSLKNMTSQISDAFNGDNKGMNKRSEELLNNTIDFLEILKK